MKNSPLSTAPKFTQKDEHWIPLSDLMTGLMMIFMLVAIVRRQNLSDILS